MGHRFWVPLQEQAAGGVGPRGVRAQLRPPPGRCGPFGGRGDVPPASGGLEGRRPRGPQAGGGSRGETGGGAAPWFPTPLPWGGGPWRRAQSPFFSGEPPLGIYVQPGLPGSPRRRARPSRLSVGQPGGGGGLPVRRTPGGSPGGLCGVGGGEFSLPGSVPPPTPGGHQGGLLRPRPCCIPGCCRSAAAHRAPLSACAELPVHSGHCGSEWAADLGHLARGCARRGCGVPPPGCAGPFGGGAGPSSPWPASGCSWAGGGKERRGEGGGRGGSPKSPPGPLASPPSGRQWAAWWFRSWMAGCRRGGAHPSPAPLHPLGAKPLCRPSLWPPALLAGGGGGEGRRGLGAATRVSSQLLAGCGAVGLPPRSLPPPSPLLEVVHVSSPRRIVGGGGVALRVGELGPAGGASRGTVASPPPRTHRRVWRGAAVTCVVACVGAGAASAAGSAGSSASG